jgi:uncharacterized protein
MIWRIFGMVMFWAIIIAIFAYLIRKKPYEAFDSTRKNRVFKWLFFGMVAYVPISIPALMWLLKRGDPVFNLFLGLVFVCIFTLLILFLYFLVHDVVHIVGRSIRYVAKGASMVMPNKGRRRFVRQLGIGVAAIPFFSFLYGTIRGKYNFTVRKVPLSFSDLPDAFDGFRFVQISDVHSGSFDSVEEVQRGIEMIGGQKPDMILFTGDFVNTYAEETDKYVPSWNALTAPHGKFAVLGNHDYGFYGAHPNLEDRERNHANVKQRYADSGFKLLLNESVKIEKGGQTIRLIGVENWGKPPFPQFGDLAKATEGVEDGEFKILMSHDPTHWDMHVLDFPKFIHLTLSGHTHGMQMGIDIPWLKFSLVKFVYPRWMDLYEVGKKFLYVNRGFGWLGMPARVGIYPEITVFELKKAV